MSYYCCSSIGSAVRFQQVARLTLTTGGLLVEFHHHTTSLHVPDRIAGHPNTVGIFVEVAYAAPREPPTATFIHGTAATIRPAVIVSVWSTEHLSVGRQIIHSICNHHGVAGVSAEPGHRQSVLTALITDGER